MKKAFAAGIFLVILTAVVVGGVYFGVKRTQDIRSKAAPAVCDMRWPASPDTACGRTTQLPSQGATNVSLSPNFHWDYGGYRTEDNGQCIQPTGCGTYAVSVYLTEGSPTGQAFARADVSGQTSPVKDVSFADFKTCDYGNVWPNDPTTCHTDRQPNIPPLKPNTTYFWRVTPFFDGVVHAEQTWVYSFTTGVVLKPPPTVAACQKVEASKDLATIKIGDSVTFTGWGTLVSTSTDSIDKIEFTVSNFPVATVAAVLDRTEANVKYYKATKDYQIGSAGTYSTVIRVHQKDADTWHF